jgi:hypothetical protein
MKSDFSGTHVVLFLSSDLAKTIHGAAVPVYGSG